jgi:hypothetical protein
MDEASVRAVLQHYIDHSTAGDEAGASTIYRPDAVLEFPQSGERFDGVANFLPWRTAYPATSVEIVPRRVRGRDGVWAAELGIRYDDGPWDFGIDILEFAGTSVTRETVYWAPAEEAPEWRTGWRAAEGEALPPPPSGELDTATVRATVERFLATPDPAAAHAIYADDAVLELPQSGELFAGVANFREWRVADPAEVQIEVDRVRGAGAVWFVELRLRHADGEQTYGVDIAEFRDGVISRETDYSLDPWEAPGWRAQWAAR